VVKRKNLSDKERQEIYEAVLLRSVNGKLKRRTTTIVANLFNVNRCYVQSIWRIAKECIAAGVPVDVSCKRKNKCGRKKIAIDMSTIATIPLNRYTNRYTIHMHTLYKSVGAAPPQHAANTSGGSSEVGRFKSSRHHMARRRATTG
jgi:hypothetical protein